MPGIARLLASTAFLLVAACGGGGTPSGGGGTPPPSGGGPGSGSGGGSINVLILSPSFQTIREDTEALLLEKPDDNPPITTFSESLHNIDIAVGTTPVADCPSRAAECETWRVRSLGALPGLHDITALRDSGDTNPALATVRVIPSAPGSASVRKVLSSSVFRSFYAVLDDAGTIYVNGTSLAIDSPRDNLYRSFDAQPLTHPLLRDVVDARSQTGIYGIALRADGDVVTWGEPSSVPNADRGPRLFNELNGLVDQSGASIIDMAVPRSRISTVRATRSRNERSEDIGIGAVLLSDGRVIGWNPFATLQRSFFASRPAFLPGVTDAVAISMESYYLSILLSDGRVLEFGSLSADVQGNTTDDAVLTTPTPIDGITNAIAIQGRTALLADGRVLQWQPTLDAVEASVPQAVVGLTDAVTLPDGRQNIARRSDGSWVGWRFHSDETEIGFAYPIDFSAIGGARTMSGDYVVDDQCGRLWETTLTLHMTETDPFFDVSGEPVPHLGGATECNAGDRSHIVYVYVRGDGAGDVAASTGSVECSSPLLTRPRLCWWFGDVTEQPTFTALPEPGSRFRDWRWDCASQTAVSAPVVLRPGNRENSENVCKVTFELQE